MHSIRRRFGGRARGDDARGAGDQPRDRPRRRTSSTGSASPRAARARPRSATRIPARSRPQHPRRRRGHAHDHRPDRCRPCRQRGRELGQHHRLGPDQSSSAARPAPRPRAPARSATPYLGVTSCTIPFNGRVVIQPFSHYTVQAGDFALPGHQLKDDAFLTWHDLCNDPAGTGNTQLRPEPADHCGVVSDARPAAHLHDGDRHPQRGARRR